MKFYFIREGDGVLRESLTRTTTPGWTPITKGEYEAILATFTPERDSDEGVTLAT